MYGRHFGVPATNEPHGFKKTCALSTFSYVDTYHVLDVNICYPNSISFICYVNPKLMLGS